MKLNITIDCTPQEARTFFGQPDLEAYNAWLVEEMKARTARNLDAMRPEELMRTWVDFGGQAAEQFRRMMEATTAGAATRSE
ncbi:MAG TPA: DUF6489 family protein [Caulobacteraceae bacterium]|jgi:hypothetical protein